MGRRSQQELRKEREQQRYAISLGKCRYHIDKDAVKGTTLCQHCVDVRKNRKLKLINNGKCRNHPQNDAIPGQKTCEVCAIEAKQQREEDIKNGMCINKHNPPKPAKAGFNICEDCSETRRWADVMRKYGLTKEEYLEECKKRDNRCDICGAQCQIIGEICDHVKKICVDHDHDTGKVRGFLCWPCNIMIGYFDKRIEQFDTILNKVSDYLKKNTK